MRAAAHVDETHAVARVNGHGGGPKAWRGAVHLHAHLVNPGWHGRGRAWGERRQGEHAEAQRGCGIRLHPDSLGKWTREFLPRRRRVTRAIEARPGPLCPAAGQSDEKDLYLRQLDAFAAVHRKASGTA